MISLLPIVQTFPLVEQLCPSSIVLMRRGRSIDSIQCQGQPGHTDDHHHCNGFHVTLTWPHLPCEKEGE